MTDDPVDWSDDDRAIDSANEAARIADQFEAAKRRLQEFEAGLPSLHRRSLCCPDDPTCPWPDACAECDQDWPCETAQSRQPKTAA